MSGRYLSIWFRHLTTDRMARRQPALKGMPFVLSARERGRMIIKAVSVAAQMKGIHPGMVVADCRAILPSLQVFEDKPDLNEQLLNALAEWCIRYTPLAAIDLPDGIMLDISGCTHLWGGEVPYLNDITNRLNNFGYHVCTAIADTIGAAWAIARFGSESMIVEPDEQLNALIPLPVGALRLEIPIIEKLRKLGLYEIHSIFHIPRSALRRRFGVSLLTRLDQALGQAIEVLHPVVPLQPYQERLPCLEPIRTATGIEIALKQLQEALCSRLKKEEKGLRKCILKAHRVDGNIQQIDIGTTRASREPAHLFKLFEDRISSLAPDLGFELFLLEAPVVEDMPATQEALWETTGSHNELKLAEFLDRLISKVGAQSVHRYLPDEHYWPEHSVKPAISLSDKPQTDWKDDAPRPIHFLHQPEPIEVTVPLPDYPPMLFVYKRKLHKIVKADGPERIEKEWWLHEGLHRDYYCVEDEQEVRYWLYRLGSYHNSEPKWFLHGVFA